MESIDDTADDDGVGIVTGGGSVVGVGDAMRAKTGTSSTAGEFSHITSLRIPRRLSTLGSGT